MYTYIYIIITARNSPQLVNLYLYNVEASCSVMCQDGKVLPIPQLFKSNVKTVIWQEDLWQMEMHTPHFSLDFLGHTDRLAGVMGQIQYYIQQTCMKSSSIGVCVCKHGHACVGKHMLSWSLFVRVYFAIL